ncbi:MAG: MFS transporter [Gammaproteobacteria bacterium]|nr:MFS transporter [Gammaproteobacteria bacterium]
MQAISYERCGDVNTGARRGGNGAPAGTARAPQHGCYHPAHCHDAYQGEFLVDRTPDQPSTQSDVDAVQIGRKVRMRLALPCIGFLLLSSLDRANLSFAAGAMSAELGLTPTQYGFGAGILFAGFLLGQYPSLFLYQYVGMRRWIATCALVWGCSAAALGFAHSPGSFYLWRIVLGFAEGGLAPGIVLYLSQFASQQERAATFALPMVAIPASIVIGGPLSGWLMRMNYTLGLPGWRWMLLVEALPTIALACAARCYFPDGPDQAGWLSAAERRWLAQHSAGSRPHQRNDWSQLRRRAVWSAALLWFCLLSGSYGLIFWLPQTLGALTRLDALAIGIIGALPWIGVGLGMYFVSRHSDRSGERRLHTAVPAAIAAVALLVALNLGPGVAAVIALFVAGLGLGGAQGTFWALPVQSLPPAALGVGVVAINICGSAGGLVMPPAMGLARSLSGGFAGPTLLVVAVLAAATALALTLGRTPAAP